MTIPERQAELDALAAEYLQDIKVETNGGTKTQYMPKEAADEEVLALCRRAKNAAKFGALFDLGDTAPYGGDDSSADLALASMVSFYTQDAEQIERLISASALGQRQKWRRPDYRRRTIERAIGGLRETYTPSRRLLVGASTSGGDAEIPGLPVVQVNNRHLRDVTSDVLAALAAGNEPPEVFVRSGALVRVREDENNVPQIQTMDHNHLRGRMARVADFARITENDTTKVNPPEVVVKDVHALGGWGLPALEAVVESPILRPDGTIFDSPGYDTQTRLAYRPNKGFEPPTIPASPTTNDVRRAVELIDEAIGEFPYEDAASASNTLGLMLTPLVRQAIDGPVPMALIDKPQAGTGGSLLAEAVAIIGTGRGAEMLGAPREDEEWRKQITAKLSSGATMITIDNVEHPLYAPSLARALTARSWTDRILGRSESITLAQRATWLATGNNIILRGDLPRRCYWVRLDAKKARPWKREGFKHPDLLRWIAENRGPLVGALLTIARGWFVAGRPKATGVPRLGSFESWAEIVGGMVEFAGIPGFLGNLEALYEKADEGGAEWEEFLASWWRVCGKDPITVAELVEKVKDDDGFRATLPPDLAETLDKGQGSFSRRLGKALSSRAGTRYGEDELHVVKAGEKKRAVKWSIQKGSTEGEFASLVSLYNPSADRDYAYKATTNVSQDASGPETNSPNSQTHPEADLPMPVSREHDLDCQCEECEFGEV